jgi:hypothetical protein
VLKTGEDCLFCFSGGNGLLLYNLSSTKWRQCFAPEQVLMFFIFHNVPSNLTSFFSFPFFW